jgi:hypothetical protein
MELGSYFLFLQEQIKDIIIMRKLTKPKTSCTLLQKRTWASYTSDDADKILGDVVASK